MENYLFEAVQGNKLYCFEFLIARLRRRHTKAINYNGLIIYKLYYVHELS